jgi:hypothetical protein
VGLGWRQLAPIAVVLAAAGAAPSVPASVEPAEVVTGAGIVRASVARFRALLGPDNGGLPQGYSTGRREIDWDGVPDEFSRPKFLPAGFFNARVSPRARGAVLQTPGAGVAVSADADNPYAAAPLRTFSKERLFSPIRSNVVSLTFRVPGTNRRAAVRGFGAVYTDVDRRENAAFEYFDAQGRSLGKFGVPARSNGLSFLGVVFREPVVARVRIVYGNGPLGPGETRVYDVAVMDDFIYGEPQAVSG